MLIFFLSGFSLTKILYVLYCIHRRSSLYFTFYAHALVFLVCMYVFVLVNGNEITSPPKGQTK